jgi:hypothetical protein
VIYLLYNRNVTIQAGSFTGLNSLGPDKRMIGVISLLAGQKITDYGAIVSGTYTYIPTIFTDCYKGLDAYSSGNIYQQSVVKGATFNNDIRELL